MISKLITGAFLAVLGSATLGLTHSHDLCEGIVPENDQYIPVFSLFNEVPTGTTEAEFNKVIDRAYEVYGPIIEEMGGTLKINRKWTDGTVNANASRQGSTWLVNMYGGLARHHTITADSFAMVLCHEIGHHLGGAPKYGWFNGWASNEGQADYFAGLKCMRKVFKNEDNIRYVEEKSAKINPFAKVTCDSIYNTLEDQALCIRTSMAGQELANLFADLRKIDLPDFQTPDAGEVADTNDRHPAAQCRLDTYFAGALCTKDHRDDVSQSDATVGTCNRRDGFDTGVRSRCWYNPDSTAAQTQNDLAFMN
ncbi:MAG: hypothetical protein HOO06_01850 [Bdellovibrionaceae bacterium]|jgi:hypothetical protein|nr:hypothetical protein [Pseudobdellovibrionaceae bacterium]